MKPYLNRLLKNKKLHKTIAVLLLLLSAGCKDDIKVIKEYYPTGQLKIIKQIKGNTEYGKGFYKNGKVAEIYTLVNGKINGDYYQYYDNGRIKNHSMFDNGIRNGLDISYNEKEKMNSEILWIEGKKLVWKNFNYFTNYKKWGYKIFYFDKTETGYPVGDIVYDTANTVINELSWYYSVKSKDTVNIKDTCEIKVFLLMPGCKTQCVLSLGNIDSTGNIKNVYFTRNYKNVFSFSFPYIPTKKGNNLILGRLSVRQDTVINNEELFRKENFIFYHNIYVK